MKQTYYEQVMQQVVLANERCIKDLWKRRCKPILGCVTGKKVK